MLSKKLVSSDTSVAVLIALALIFSASSEIASAQEEEQASNIVRPQPDSNGVDLVTGGIYISEPNFGAPGASKLQLMIGRNEKGHEINSLYATLTAQVLDPSEEGAQWPRLYAAVINGLSVRFTCVDYGTNSGECWEDTPHRGAALEYINGSYLNGYIYTGPDGTRAQFPPVFQEDVANNGVLEAIEVLYPSGEKISFQSTAQGGVLTRTWTSNLGYSASTVNVGLGASETRRLYKSGQLLNTITTIREAVNGSPYINYTRRVTDDLGRTVRIRHNHVQGPLWYNKFGGIAWFENATGLRTTLGYHSVSGPSNGPWNSAYSDLVVSTLQRNGQTWSYAFGGIGSPKLVTDPLGAVREVTTEPASAYLASFGNIISNKLPSGRTNSFEYYNYVNASTAIDHLAAVTSPEGNKSKYEYDDRGNLTKTTAIPKSGGAGHVVYQASFPATCSNRKTCNKPQWTRDSAGGQTDYTYDSTHGGLLTKLGPVDANGKRRKTWNEYASDDTGNGLLWRLSATHVCSVFANGANSDCQTAAEQVTRFTYWVHMVLPWTETRTNGIDSVSATTTYGYDAWGRVLSITDPTGVIKYFRYDLVGRKTWEIAANGAGSWVAQKLTYDDGDHIIRIDRGTLPDPSSTALAIQGSTINTYDVEGRQIKSEFVDATSGRLSVGQTSYDALSRPVCSVVRMNPAVFDATADACAVGSAGTYGPDRVTKNSYDVDGRLSKTVQGFGATNSGLGITSVEMGFTTNGQLAWRKDGNGNQTSYSYDSYDRLDRTTFADASFEKSEYDSAGRLSKFTKRNGHWLNHGYDGASRLVSTSFSNGEPTVARDYDGQGRSTTVSRSGQTITYGWGDALGRLASETQPSGTVSYNYDLSGRQSRITWPGSYWVDYDYNSAGSLWRVRELGATSGLGLIASWTFDALGRRATLTRGNGTVTAIARDAAGRLTNLSHDVAGTAMDTQYSFERNPASQIISRTFSNSAWVWAPASSSNVGYAPDALNRYSSVSGAAFSYDGNGNLTNDGSRTYGYDFLNHLTSASGGGAPSAALAYDPLDRLQSVSANGLTTRFLYDGSKMIADFDAAGNLLHRYVPGLGVDMPLVSLEGSATAANSSSAPNTARWPLADERGSVVGLVNASGSVSINTYGTYGEPAAPNLGRFGYTGQLWLPEVGLYHFKARAYNPRLGRFMQTDPVGYADGLNLYTYVRNDPLNYFDPTGTQTPETNPFSGGNANERKPDPKDKCAADPDLCTGTPKQSLPPIQPAEAPTAPGAHGSAPGLDDKIDAIRDMQAAGERKNNAVHPNERAAAERKLDTEIGRYNKAMGWGSSQDVPAPMSADPAPVPEVKMPEEKPMEVDVYDPEGTLLPAGSTVYDGDTVYPRGYVRKPQE